MAFSSILRYLVVFGGILWYLVVFGGILGSIWVSWTHANYLYMGPHGAPYGPIWAHIKVVSMCPESHSGASMAISGYIMIYQDISLYTYIYTWEAWEG